MQKRVQTRVQIRAHTVPYTQSWVRVPPMLVQVCGSKRLTCHAGHQEVSRCCPKAESDESVYSKRINIQQASEFPCLLTVTGWLCSDNRNCAFQEGSYLLRKLNVKHMNLIKKIFTHKNISNTLRKLIFRILTTSFTANINMSNANLFI